MKLYNINGDYATKEEIRTAYEESLKEEKLFVKGAVVKAWPKCDKDYDIHFGLIERRGRDNYELHDTILDHAAPLDWETLGYTIGMLIPDAEWFVRLFDGDLIWGKGAPPVVQGESWNRTDWCICPNGQAYRIPTHEPADDWRDSFRRIERI